MGGIKYFDGVAKFCGIDVIGGKLTPGECYRADQMDF